ncbi:MAG TPA: sugar ABC transporter permease [Anaerolineae bacterium]|nr:sugar ABC transporter permease [Anaerolineae bacterium]
MYRNKYRVIIPFLFPSLLLYLTFVIYPYLRAMYISLTRWHGLAKEPEFVGLANFSKMIHNEYFWNALGNNGVYMLVLPVFTIGLALFFAFLLTQGVPFGKFYRVSYFFPQVMSIVAVGVLWSFVYHPTIGMLNSLLHLVGVSNPPVWLGNPHTVLGAVSAVMIWQAIGFFMVMFIAGMEAVPVGLYEAAKIDGATGWHIFWHITIPMIWETLQTAIIFILIGAANMFAVTQTMTEGGPSRSSEVLSTYLYDEAFLNSKFGYGTAVAVALFIIILSISVVIQRLMRRDTLEY